MKNLQSSKMHEMHWIRDGRPADCDAILENAWHSTLTAMKMESAMKADGTLGGSLSDKKEGLRASERLPRDPQGALHGHCWSSIDDIRLICSAWLNHITPRTCHPWQMAITWWSQFGVIVSGWGGMHLKHQVHAIQTKGHGPQRTAVNGFDTLL